MELDKGWKYKHGSTKPRHTCPYCGAYGYISDYDIDANLLAHYCEVCDSEWHENNEYWTCIQANGYITKE